VGAHTGTPRSGGLGALLRGIALAAVAALLVALVARTTGSDAEPADAAPQQQEKPRQTPSHSASTSDPTASPAVEEPEEEPPPTIVARPPLALTLAAQQERERERRALARQRRMAALELKRERHREKMQVRLDALPASFVQLDESTVTTTTSFVVSSFNVLGHGHTKPGGNKPGFADAAVRSPIQASLLRRHGVSVAGLQEFTITQHRQLRRHAPEYEIWPGSRLGKAAAQNSIIWRRGEWSLVQAGTTPIPYFHGNRIPMPHVLLRNRATGQLVWFGNYHNPASTRGNARGYRNTATDLEAALARRLARTGHPVIMTGDMNERAEFFCRFTRTTPMRSADGGYGDRSGCKPPPRPRIDWIIGSPRLDFSDYAADDSAQVDRSTDHPMIRSRATVGPDVVLDQCVDLAPLGTWCPKR
jgi:hypothetical protein